MSINEILNYKTWLEENVSINDPFAPSSVRLMMKSLIMGRNYRLLTERNTREKLFRTYAWLIDAYSKAKQAYGENWQAELLNALHQLRRTKEGDDLSLWLIGLTRKTADNLDVQREEYGVFLQETLAYCRTLFSRIGRDNHFDDAWLLLMAGSATLNIRGSQKSFVGKKLEKLFLKTALTTLGFELNQNFWMNIERDEEVGREADGEVESRRGRIRFEVGLIARGNQEVIEDKISRVGRNGVVLCDRLGTRSRVYDSAQRESVKLIQIRHGEPLVELKNHLTPLVTFILNDPPHTEAQIDAVLNQLSDSFFSIQ